MSMDKDSVQNAMEVIDKFFVAFNNADNESLKHLYNYPHIFLFGNGKARFAEDADGMTMDFERLREQEGWHRSALDTIKATSVSGEKVHFELIFSRYHEDGTKYSSTPALWILTKKDGHWGIQVRSLMPASFTAD
jgi:ketosteroid isomerase-like protein